MSTTQATIDTILLALPTGVTAKKMFGEYGLYFRDKMVALVCDDRLYVKPTTQGREVWGPCDEESPYPSAKPCMAIEESKYRDKLRLQQLLEVTWQELPVPIKKKKKSK